VTSVEPFNPIGVANLALVAARRRSWEQANKLVAQLIERDAVRPALWLWTGAVSSELVPGDAAVASTRYVDFAGRPREAKDMAPQVVWAASLIVARVGHTDDAAYDDAYNALPDRPAKRHLYILAVLELVAGTLAAANPVRDLDPPTA
jgi:hypothetical protein